VCKLKNSIRLESLNRSAALENLDDNVGINSVSRSVREYVETSAKESIGYCYLKHNKQCFTRGDQNYELKGNKAN
jgi:hypothetical protein